MTKQQLYQGSDINNDIIKLQKIIKELSNLHDNEFFAESIDRINCNSYSCDLSYKVLNIFKSTVSNNKNLLEVLSAKIIKELEIELNNLITEFNSL